MAFRGKVEEHAAQREMAIKLIALVRLSDMQITGDITGGLRATDGLALETGIDALVASMYTIMCEANEQAFGFVMEVVQKLKQERSYAAEAAAR